MTKRLIEAMHGTIGVESKVDIGTKFWVELIAVVATPVDFPDVVSPASPDPLAANPLPKKIVLYVEDNPANLKLVEMLVARRPELVLLTAGNGDLGIELAQAHRPDVILMDINLPGTSGLKALSVLRRHPDTNHIPIIALSANARPRDIEAGLKAGFLKYLTKPIKVAELLDTLDLTLAEISAHTTSA